MFEAYYKGTLEERFSREVELLDAFLRDKSYESSSVKNDLNKLADKLDLRITLIDGSKKLIYDTASPSTTEANGYVKYIKENLEVESKIKTFEDNQNHQIYYYSDVISIDRDGQVYIYLAVSQEHIQVAHLKIWTVLGLSLLTAFIFMTIFGARIASSLTRPIESATHVATELLKGNYRARTNDDIRENSNLLSDTINQLAKSLQGLIMEQESQKERLLTLIENMGSGLILINERGHVTLVNHTFLEEFQIESDSVLGRLYYEVVPNRAINNLIEEIFMTETKVRKQISLSIGIDIKHFEVYGAPIIGTNEEWKGIVLVFHDISELKRLESVRKDFLVNVSHELKTPITSIKGFSETLLEGAYKDEKTLKHFLTIIHKESDRMQELILDLLDLSKIEQRTFELNVSFVNISELLEEITLMLQGKAKEKDQELLCEALEDVYVEGDVYRLKQVFINLVGNAIVYTPNGGKISIKVKDGDYFVKVSVKDTGIGMSKDEIPRVFERFYRIDKARSRNSGGTGLGLAIVKHIVEAHKGEINVTSVLGKGSKFTVTLPKQLKHKGHE